MNTLANVLLIQPPLSLSLFVERQQKLKVSGIYNLDFIFRISILILSMFLTFKMPDLVFEMLNAILEQAFVLYTMLGLIIMCYYNSHYLIPTTTLQIHVL